MRLTDKVAIITGSGRGIGQEIARMFAAEGANVVVADIQMDIACSTAAEISTAGGVSLALQVDVADQASVEDMMHDTLAHFGRLDIMVSNAAIGTCAPFLNTTLQEWNRVLQVNLTGTFLCGQAAARAMVKRNYGKIINVASISGQRGGQGRAAYGAAKAGVILLTRVMAVELAPCGINVNAISPGPVDTDQSRLTHTPGTRRSYYDRMPVGRYGERREVAAAALFLASDESSFVHGHILNVDGGFAAAGLMYHDDQENLVGPEAPKWQAL